MTTWGYLFIALVLIGLSVIYSGIVNMVKIEKVNRCGDIIRQSTCPKCRISLGPAMRSAKWKEMKFTGAGGRRLKGRDYPTELIILICPECSAELAFRMDGSLFACNHEVTTEQKNA